MKKNVGGIDRFLRLVVGLLLLAGKFAGVSLFSGTLGTVLAVVGAIFVVTGAIGYCPLYSILGISTSGK